MADKKRPLWARFFKWLLLLTAIGIPISIFVFLVVLLGAFVEKTTLSIPLAIAAMVVVIVTVIAFAAAVEEWYFEID